MNVTAPKKALTKIKAHISRKNSKIGKIANFSLAPIKSCSNCKYCFQPDIYLKCYAMQGYLQYPIVANAWDENLRMARRSPAKLFKQIEAYLNKYSKSFFRIHVAGDFFSQSYLDRWSTLCAKYPKIRFLAFTKAFELDFSEVPKNLKIMYSIMPNMPQDIVPSKGSRAYVGDSIKAHKRKRERVFPCAGNCENCLTCWSFRENESVNFEIHGPGITS